MFYALAFLVHCIVFPLGYLARLIGLLHRCLSNLHASLVLFSIFLYSRGGAQAFLADTMHGNVSLFAYHAGASPNEICLDTGCSRPLFRLDTLGMLTGVREEKARAYGIAGQSANITHTGYWPGKEKLIGKIYCSSDVKLNLMGVPQLMKNGCEVVGKGESLKILEPSGDILFDGKLNNRGLFTCAFAHFGAYPRVVKGVDSGGVKGVYQEAPRAPQVLFEEDDHEFDISKYKSNMSDAELFRFMHGHFTQEEKKRAMQAWNFHSTMAHMVHQALGDAFENGLFAGVKLTRKDLDNAYKLFGPCVACMEGKFKLPSEPPSETPPAPTVGHTLNADFYVYKLTTLGGYNYVLIVTDQKSGAIFTHTSRTRQRRVWRQVFRRSLPASTDMAIESAR